MTKLTIMPDKWIRVFEHQKLEIGTPVSGGIFEERHWRKLNHFLTFSRYPYFQVFARGVQFRQYVGVIQVDELTIEVVPKADREQSHETGSWQQVLIDMLSECQLWRGEWIAGAQLQVKSGHLLEWYCQFFLDQTEKLLRRGLLKQYNRHQEKHKTLRGRLLMHKQAVETQPLFWTDRESYDFNHPYNQWIKAALQLLCSHFPDQYLRQRAQALDHRFPALPNVNELPPLGKIRESHYQSVLLIAQLLLNHYTPIARRGSWPLLAILFDMNVLFEEYIARQLERFRPPGAKVGRQVSTPFWNRRNIRPDLVLEWRGKRLVLDTKWKMMPTSQPGMEDLRQIYVYNEYFSADQGVLLYPQAHDFFEWPAIPFAPVRGGKQPAHSCRVLSTPVVKANGKLNRALGKELWERLFELV